MSRENVKKMFARIQNDPKLWQDHINLMKENENCSEKVIADKIVESGKRSGFDFSAEDVFQASAELVDTKGNNKELSDEDLGNVAGGGSKTQQADPGPGACGNCSGMRLEDGEPMCMLYRKPVYFLPHCSRRRS